MKILATIKNIFKRKKHPKIFEININDAVNSLSNDELYTLLGDKNIIKKRKDCFITIPKNNNLH